MNKRNKDLLIGPIILLITTVLLKDFLGIKGAQAVGTLLWMIYWWIKRPVNMAVTGLVPVIANAFLSMVPMVDVISKYASESIILIFGSSLLIMPWSKIGLDRRIALKCLSIIGPSMRSQIIVWLTISALLSSVLPNTIVAALLVPIACAMLAAAGYEDIPSSAPAVPILFCITWGVGIGGMGTPMGGAMNLVAINLIQDYTGSEVLYFDWIIKVLPFLLLSLVVLYFWISRVPNEVKRLEGSKEFFKNSYAELGPIKYDEKLCMITFGLAVAGSLLRPLYADLLPGVVPAYLFLAFGCMNFFMSGKDKEPLLTFETAQQKLMWSMMICFAGGFAAGELINGSGAATAVADIITNMSLDGGITTLIVFVVAIKLISEVTSSTTGAAVIIPIMISFCMNLDLNAVPYIMILVFGFSGIFVLPISWQAIPVGYGLNADKLMKYGIVSTVLNIVLAILVGFVFLNYWPQFSVI